MYSVGLSTIETLKTLVKLTLVYMEHRIGYLQCNACHWFLRVFKQGFIFTEDMRMSFFRMLYISANPSSVSIRDSHGVSATAFKHRIGAQSPPRMTSEKLTLRNETRGQN